MSKAAIFTEEPEYFAAGIFVKYPIASAGQTQRKRSFAAPNTDVRFQAHFRTWVINIHYCSTTSSTRGGVFFKVSSWCGLGVKELSD